MKRLYRVLGISENATTKEIKRAYKKAAQKHHPDKLKKDISGEELELAKKFWLEICQAYETLKNPETRKQYDATGDTNSKASRVMASASTIHISIIKHLLMQSPNLDNEIIVDNMRNMIKDNIDDLKYKLASVMSERKALESRINKGDSDIEKKISNVAEEILKFDVIPAIEKIEEEIEVNETALRMCGEKEADEVVGYALEL